MMSNVEKKPVVTLNDLVTQNAQRTVTVTAPFHGISKTVWKAGQEKLTLVGEPQKTRRPKIPENITEEHTTEHGCTYNYTLTFTSETPFQFFGWSTLRKPAPQDSPMVANWRSKKQGSNLTPPAWNWNESPVKDMPHAETRVCAVCGTRRHTNLYCAEMKNKGVCWIGETCLEKETFYACLSDISFGEELKNSTQKMFTLPVISLHEAVAGFLMDYPQFVDNPDMLVPLQQEEYYAKLLPAAVIISELEEKLVPETEWERNMKTMLDIGLTSEAQQGLLRSFQKTHHQLMGDVDAAEEYGMPPHSAPYTDDWWGKVGERKTSKVRVDLCFTKYRNDGSAFDVVTMRTVEGNYKLTWFSTPNVAKVGQMYDITATVKKQDVFRNQKSCIVNRVKGCEPEKPKGDLVDVHQIFAKLKQ